MPWVRFTDDFYWTPAADRRRTTAYKTGHQVLITTACARAAAGKWVRIPAPARGWEPTGGQQANRVRPGDNEVGDE